MRKLLIAGVLSVAAAAQAMAAALPAGQPAPAPGAEILPLLHAGRFDAADRLLERTADGDAARRGFLRAFVTYWRLLYDPENEDLLARLESQLDRVVDEADGDGPSPPSLWAGSARLLRAQLYASLRKPFKAAFEAKRAKALLEGALDGDQRAEASFGLGTYNYFASRVPALVKGLRFILALPGGDRERGLDQLSTASRESRYFAFEARVLLVSIYSGSHERDYRSALHEAEIALDTHPPCVALLYAAAILDLSVGRPEHALERLDRAWAEAASRDDTDAAVRARIHYQRARAELARFRPDRALERLAPLLDGSVAVPASLRDDLDRMVERTRAWTADADGAAPKRPKGKRDDPGPAARESLRRAIPALERERHGQRDAAADRLSALIERHPDDAGLALLAGRSLLLAGRELPRALSLLEGAERSGRLPREWVGPCRLLAGAAADALGQRERAVDHYRAAIDAPAFIERGAAHLYLDTPFELPESGRSGRAHAGG